MGADWVEVDVRITSDKALVLAHDYRVQGLEVGAATLRQLRKAWHPLATLEEGLEAATGMGVNLELKAPLPDPEEFVSLLAATAGGFDGPLLVSSFYQPILPMAAQAMHYADVGVLTGHSYDPKGRMAVTAAVEGGYRVALPEDPAVTGPLIGDAHTHGRRIITWTVNLPERIRELAGWGIDGIITDEPDRALAALET